VRDVGNEATQRSARQSRSSPTGGSSGRGAQRYAPQRLVRYHQDPAVPGDRRAYRVDAGRLELRGRLRRVTAGVVRCRGQPPVPGAEALDGGGVEVSDPGDAGPGHRVDRPDRRVCDDNVVLAKILG